MTQWQRYLHLLMVGLALVACSTGGKTAEKPLVQQPAGPSKQQVEFDRGLAALDAQRYAEAAEIFDRLLVQKPASELDLVTLFDSGSAYEGMGDCQVASDRFRQVVRASANKFHRIESEALYHLSLMYECLGQDTKAITSLLDARRRSKDLPTEIASAEIPARLAAAYARIGNRSKALDYFNLASTGLKNIVNRGGRKPQIDLVGRTLYLMGQLSPAQRRAEASPQSYFQSLGIQQNYLLQAIEIEAQPYATSARDDLKLAYDNIWQFKIVDPEARRDFYLRGVQVIHELRKIRAVNAPPGEQEVFDFLDQTERRLQTELARATETNPLTTEAQSREGLKRQGRLVSPKPPGDGDKQQP